MEVQRLGWAQGLTEETLQEMLAACEILDFEAGQRVLEVGEPITHAHFLIRGQVAVTLYDAVGKEVFRSIAVTANIEKDFMGVRSKRRSFGSRFFSTIQVVMRQNMIQSYSMNSVGIQPADFVVAPDVTMFDITEFTRSDEMAEIGKRATEESIVQLRSMLVKLDSKLFS